MTNPWMTLLAQTAYEDRLKGLRSAFHERQSDPADMRVFSAFFIAIAAVIIALVLIRCLRAPAGTRSTARHPWRIYNRVLRRLGLGLVDRFIMRMLAADATVTHPTSILFSRDLFERSASRWVESITLTTFRRHARRRLRAIGRIAFPRAAMPES